MGDVAVDLVVPVKSLRLAKSRLRGAVGPDRHAGLVLAVLTDTVTAAASAEGVRRVLVVSSDPAVAARMAAEGIECVPEGSSHGLNAAFRHGADLLRSRDPGGQVGALQADLPALRPDELADALAHARLVLDAGTAPRAFCADAHGEGTTLLVAAAGVPLAPRFGPGSAEAHERAGALRLRGEWPGLRQDVDTPEDLRRAAELGLGPATLAALRTTARPRR
jgi:2-phospho-L-lactate guanylyltransferase